MADATPRYTRTFRADAVELVVSSGRLIRQLASDLGLADRTLRTWVTPAAVDVGRGQGELTSAECEEVRQLRRENRVLQHECGILKHADAFFANETR